MPNTSKTLFATGRRRSPEFARGRNDRLAGRARTRPLTRAYLRGYEAEARRHVGRFYEPPLCMRIK